MINKSIILVFSLLEILLFLLSILSILILLRFVYFYCHSFNLAAEKQDKSVVFVLGSGGPKTQKVFQHQKEIVKEFINNKTRAHTTFTVITYGLDSAKTWKVDEPNKGKRNELIDSVSWNGHGTRLDLGLNKAYNVLKNKKPKTQKRVYIFVSQVADVGSDPVKKAVSKLLEDGTELITIQVIDGSEGEEKKVVPRTKFVVKSRVRDDPKRLAQLLIVTLYFGKAIRLVF